MGLIKMLKEKSNQRELEAKRKKFEAANAKDLKSKSRYENMTLKEAQVLFNKRVHYGSFRQDEEFSLFLFLKFSPFAPKGLDFAKNTSEDYITAKYKFMLEACLRFGINPEHNGYMKKNYEGVFENMYHFEMEDIWNMIDKGDLLPLDRDDWLFDVSLYNETKVGDNLGKIKIIVSCLDPEFVDYYGLVECTDPVNQLKIDGKFMSNKEMNEQLVAWQTKNL